jgi:hypothetical protein
MHLQFYNSYSVQSIQVIISQVQPVLEINEIDLLDVDCSFHSIILISGAICVTPTSTRNTKASRCYISLCSGNCDLASKRMMGAFDQRMVA